MQIRLQWWAMAIAFGLIALGAATWGRQGRVEQRPIVLSDGIRTVRLARASGAERTALQLRSDYLAAEVTLVVGDRTYRISRASLGATIDEARLLRIVRAAQGRQGWSGRFVTLHAGSTAEVTIQLPVSVDRARTRERLAQLRQRIGRDGRSSFSLTSATDRAAAVLSRGQLVVDLDVVESGDTETGRRPAAEFGVVVSTFRTYVTGPGTSDAAAAVAAIDGRVIAPGTEFSLLRVLSPAAPRCSEIVRSQIATTLFAAAFLGGLDIREQHLSEEGFPWIERGLDTVVDGTTELDLRVLNPNPFPLRVDASYRAGELAVRLRGVRQGPRVVWSHHRVSREAGERFVRNRTVYWSDGPLIELDEFDPAS